MNLRVVD